MKARQRQRMYDGQLMATQYPDRVIYEFRIPNQVDKPQGRTERRLIKRSWLCPSCVPPRVTMQSLVSGKDIITEYDHAEGCKYA